MRPQQKTWRLRYANVGPIRALYYDVRARRLRLWLAYDVLGCVEFDGVAPPVVQKLAWSQPDVIRATLDSMLWNCGWVKIATEPAWSYGRWRRAS